jgi:cobalt-zinc-cadmium efflux system protein
VRRPLLVAILITLTVLAVEVTGGILANSLALLSDAGHVLTDLLALVLTFTAFLISSRPPSPRRSFGYYRIEILAALVNGALLLVIAAAILRESFMRFAAPEAVRIGPMIVAASVGFAGNLAAVLVLYSERSNLNVRGALFHVLGDTLSSVGVLLAALAMWLTGFALVDPIMGALIAVVIVIGAIGLLKESVDILLEACPVGIDTDRVAARMREMRGVQAVHDLHIWSITSGMHALSGHIVLAEGHSGPTDDLLARLQGTLKEEFGIAHTTIQIETESFEEIGHVH